MIRGIVRRFSSKFFHSGEEALKDVKDGIKICVAGFGVAGVAENCLRILHEKKIKNITFYSNSVGLPGWGPGVLVDHHQISKIIVSFIGGNDNAEKQYLNGEVEIEYMPQGNLVERLRSGQAGIDGFYSPTGVGTPLEAGGFPQKLRNDGTPEKVSEKFEKANFNGKDYLLYPSYKGIDYTFLRAYVADKFGNLRYRRSARNFNPDIAGVGKMTIAEAEHIVDRLPPDKIHTPGYLVDRVFQGSLFTHKIERLIVRYPPLEGGEKPHPLKARDKIIRRAMKELKPGMCVNLGIGMPAEIPTHLPENHELDLQVENGIVGAGQYPYFNEIDSETINASKEPITVLPGYSVSNSTGAFGMMRGKHIHMTVLGGFQVSQDGDLANWMIPGKRAKGMGGAMDLAACCPKVVVTMEHCQGTKPRILPKCTYPITASKVVSTVVTELAVFNIENGKMILKEKVKEISLDQLKKITPANYIVDPNLKDYEF